MLASWAGTTPAVLTAVVLLLLPGWVVARSWHLRGWVAAGAALPLSLVLIGLAEFLAHDLRLRWLPYGWLVIAVLTAMAVALGQAWSWHQVRRGGGMQGDRASSGPSTRLMLAAIALVCVTIGGCVVVGSAGADSPAQAFDAVFHQSGVYEVRTQGNASSFGGLSALSQGSSSYYYPTVWHGAVALLPGPVVQASNAMVLVLASFLWPLQVAALLTQTLWHPRASEVPASSPAGPDRARQGAAAAVTVLAGAAVGGPMMLLTTLSAWPYALSVVALPGTVLLCLAARQAFRAGTGRVQAVVLAGGAVLGGALAHGTTVFNLAVLLVPFLVMDLVTMVRRGGRARGLSLLGAGLGLVLACLGAWYMRRPLSAMFSYVRGGGSAAATLGQALADLPQYGPLASRGLPVGIILLGLCLWAWRSRHQPEVGTWFAVLGLALVLIVLVGGPQWPPRQVGAVWYLQKSRIQPLVLIPGFVLAAQGAAALLSRQAPQGARPRRWGRGTVLAAVVGLALIGRVPLQVAQVSSVHDAQRIAFGTLTTPEEIAFYRRLPELLPPGAIVIGAPSRGVSYVGPVAQVETLYPSRGEPSAGSAHYQLEKSRPRLQPGSWTCSLLEELGAWYYIKVDRDPADLRYGNAPLRWDADLAGWPPQGMTLVAQEDTGRGSISLWKITGCGEVTVTP